MSPVRSILFRSCLTVASALAGCGTPAPPKADMPSLEQRLLELERRVERLEARPVIESPYRSKVEVQAHIKALEAERDALLVRYRDQHPDIRDINRRLGILNSQLQMMEQP